MGKIKDVKIMTVFKEIMKAYNKGNDVISDEYRKELEAFDIDVPASLNNETIGAFVSQANRVIRDYDFYLVSLLVGMKTSTPDIYYNEYLKKDTLDALEKEWYEKNQGNNLEVVRKAYEDLQNKAHAKMKKGSFTQMKQYNQYVLSSLNPFSYSSFSNHYSIAYLKEDKALAINYELPELTDISYLVHFVLKEDGKVEEVDYVPKSYKHEFYENTIFRLFIRIASIVYNSDSYHLIDHLHIQGYTHIFDDHYGIDIPKYICHTKIDREDLEMVDLKQTMFKDFFYTIGYTGSKNLTYDPANEMKPVIEFSKIKKK